MTLFRWFALSLLVLQPLGSIADSWHELLRYSCDSQTGLLQIEYLGAYNEEGNSLVMRKTENDVNPWDLVVIGNDPRYVVRTNTVEKHCRLRTTVYFVELGALPCNFDLHGMNGGMMQAYARIRRGNFEISKEVFGSCSVLNERVTTKVELLAGHKLPVVTRKAAREYFK